MLEHLWLGIFGASLGALFLACIWAMAFAIIKMVREK